jgi:hypothetical protein
MPVSNCNNSTSEQMGALLKFHIPILVKIEQQQCTLRPMYFCVCFKCNFLHTPFPTSLMVFEIFKQMQENMRIAYVGNTFPDLCTDI